MQNYSEKNVGRAKSLQFRRIKTARYLRVDQRFALKKWEKWNTMCSALRAKVHLAKSVTFENV